MGLWRLRQDALADEDATQRRLCITLAEQTALAFREIDLILRETRQSLATGAVPASGEGLHKQLRERFMLALRDYYRFSQETRDISRRQHDLLQLLLSREDRSVTLQALHLDPVLAPLYRSVSEKTARRDLERLTQLKLLLQNGKRYVLNPFALDS